MSPSESDRESSQVSATRVTDRSADRRTLVAFHAHPDDESLFTGGTLARAAAEGHRTVVVTATLGEKGLTGGPSGALGADRREELRTACSILGVARLVTLDYGDSGMDESVPPPAGSLCAAPTGEIAERVRAVLVEEGADALTVYDAHGGYGHRDHIRVHDAGLLAAQGLPGLRVFAATVPREPLVRVVRALNRVGVRPGGMTAERLAGSYSARADITHAVNVRRFVPIKIDALRAHATQTTGGNDVRTVRLLTRPGIAQAVLAREWFVELGDTPGRPLGRSSDLLAVSR
jgi:LmbE family N-acetylglucosaminyl deacetylase